LLQPLPGRRRTTQGGQHNPPRPAAIPCPVATEDEMQGSDLRDSPSAARYLQFVQGLLNSPVGSLQQLRCLWVGRRRRPHPLAVAIAVHGLTDACSRATCLARAATSLQPRRGQRVAIATGFTCASSTCQPRKRCLSQGNQLPTSRRRRPQQVRCPPAVSIHRKAPPRPFHRVPCFFCTPDSVPFPPFAARELERGRRARMVWDEAAA
jgi:hypothetical protein